MLVAFEHLLRLNELVRTQTGTAADKHPLQWADAVFKDRHGEMLGWDGRGRPVGKPAVMEMRMPPCKTDQLGLSGVMLRSPFPVGRLPPRDRPCGGTCLGTRWKGGVRQ